MAKLSSDLLSQVKTASLARITNATSVAEAIATVKQRLASATLVSPQDVINRSAVSGVVLQGSAQANVLTGKDGSGRPHIAVRTNFFLCTPAVISTFTAGLSTMDSIEDVQNAYYGFIDAHCINGVIWDNEPAWESRGNQGKWSGYLRADATTGDVSIAGLAPEKPQHVIKARAIAQDFDAEVEIPSTPKVPTGPTSATPPPPVNAPANWKSPAGDVFAESALVAQGWTPELLSANGYIKA
ncbi:MAG: hypothetical protein EKK63_02385 [Acinetobacter sp.]|uniref:hypothetical protein n=1 Tax=Acinetobacter sp. TaxID=472 RepID=UPI000FA73969|nr:hypothetical protein [Acinetobacter sp.]RUP42165.1 MAG: hypothetical protein EKK63_02385 [Acinetobacter sp.]